MRRLAAMAASCAALLVMPAWGQMRGGSRGFAPHSVRFAGAPRGQVFFHGGFSRGPRFQSGFRRNSFFFRRRYLPYRRFYPGIYGGYSYPVVFDSPAEGYYDSGYDNQRGLENKISRLSDEVERLREDQDARSEPAQPQPAKPPVLNSSTPTVLVFKDKHTQEVNNYAIVGPTVWIFTEQRATKVALASLDVDATTRLNDEHGVDFRLPN